MKLSHFVMLAVLVAGAGIFGLTQACKSDDVPPPSSNPAQGPPPREPRTPTLPTPTDPASPHPTTPPTPATPATPSGPTAPATASDLPARDYDADVIAWSKRSIPGDKLKDATKGKTWKLNIYKDAGMTTVNRAKVDLDRDDKWDEKYTFEPTKITLQRSPADDDKYTETYHWNGSGWTKE